MTLTEAEAKTKWCPFARVGGPMQSSAEGTSYNRWQGSDGTTEAMLGENHITLCIGSACMAWRWHADAEDHVAARGHCGLVGP
jgi:hypothetical protein